MIVAPAGISVESNQHIHCDRPSGPPQDLQGGGFLLWAVHLVSQGGTADNIQNQFF